MRVHRRSAPHAHTRAPPTPAAPPSPRASTRVRADPTVSAVRCTSRSPVTPTVVLVAALAVAGCGGPTRTEATAAPARAGATTADSAASPATGTPPAATGPDVATPRDLSWPPVGERITHTDAEWRRLLTPAQYEILREHGTEPAGSGEYAHHHAAGTYACAGCGAPLFRSTDKFESGTGWPSFTRTYEPGRVTVRTDLSYGMVRRALTCSRCEGHLGHVFDDGPPPTGERYCIDSLSLAFVPDPAR